MEEKDRREGHRKRMRERYREVGFKGFMEYEKAEMLLMLCIGRKDVRGLAKVLVEKFGTTRGIMDAEMEELVGVKGIGQEAATGIKIIRGLMEAYQQEEVERESGEAAGGRPLELYWQMRMGSEKKEVVEVAYMDGSGRLLKGGIVRMEEGIADRVHLYPRKILEVAMRKHASGIILGHNHPSGAVEPSDGDLAVTRKLKSAGELLGIRLVDHLIVAGHRTYSFRRSGLLDGGTAG